MSADFAGRQLTIAALAKAYGARDPWAVMWAVTEEWLVTGPTLTEDEQGPALIALVERMVATEPERSASPPPG